MWDCAKDPAAGERYRLHLRVQEFMHPPGPAERRIRELLLERARAELEMASAATSPDVRLRFDLGEVYQDLRHYEEAVRVLEPALALAPRHSAAARAWLALAYSAAHLDRSREERDAYNAYLAVALDDRSTLSVLSNRAEAEMRLGNLDEAVAGYRDVIERIERAPFGQVEDFVTLVLARWGLAVALDRDGDPADAEHQASIVSQQDPDERIIGASEDDGVFFVPRVRARLVPRPGPDSARQAGDRRARRAGEVEPGGADVGGLRPSCGSERPLARAGPGTPRVGGGRAHRGRGEGRRASQGAVGVSGRRPSPHGSRRAR